MASSAVEICNAALLKLGAERISALTEDNKRARLCDERYDGIRKEVLRAHPWNFALKRASLVKLVSTPEFQFDNEFQLPNDCLRVVRTDDEDVLNTNITPTQPAVFSMSSPPIHAARYKIEGRKLLTNDDEVKILYIRDEEDTTKFDPNFDEALATRLAAEFAYNLVQSTTVARDMFNLYEVAIKRARTQDGQEGTPDDLMPDYFLQSRL